MTPLPSWTRPLARDLRARLLIWTVQRLAVIVAVGLVAVIVARTVLHTLVALPTLIDPAMVPGCC